MRVGHQPGNNPELSNSKKGGRGAATGLASSEAKHIEKNTGPEMADLPEAQGASGKRANLDVKAEISNKSREFANAKAVATSAPDVRADKIAELKRRIADKSYKVDNVAVADKLVDEHLRAPDRD